MKEVDIYFSWNTTFGGIRFHFWWNYKQPVHVKIIQNAPEGGKGKEYVYI